MRILLTNDDGVDAPALVPFALALGRLGDVVVSVPDSERSWVGKAITRFEDVRLDTVHRDGVVLHTCSGYPADAAQIGIHLLGGMPDIVVSGINLGFNHGAGFLMSSGTVGAAVEGWISGLPAVAFSTGEWGGDWAAWRAQVLDPDSRPEWEALADACTSILEDLMATSLTAKADVVSINLPFDATRTTPRRLTAIARVGYGRLFEPAPDGRVRHAFSGLVEFEPIEGTDLAAAADRVVSITPVSLPRAIEVDDDVRRQIEGS